MGGGGGRGSRVSKEDVVEGRGSRVSKEDVVEGRGSRVSKEDVQPMAILQILSQII